MRLLNSILGASALALVMSSCGNVDFKKTKGGMPYKLFPSKSGKKVTAGSVVKVNFIQKLNDSTLFSTYDKSPVYFPVSNESQPYDISEVITSLKQGDSVYAVQLIDTFMKRRPEAIPPQFKKGDRIITSLKVLDVFSNQADAQKDEAKERETAFGKDTKVQEQLRKDDKVITDYLAKNNIKAEKVGHGVYVQVLNPGAGPKIELGKWVSLRYRGTDLATGKEFDSNMGGGKPSLDMVVNEGQTIRGFLDGLLALNKGAKAKIYIPSSLGYGANASGPISPNENLVFDIEVLEVADQPLPPKNAPSPSKDTTRR